jgi:hypothetical protein
MSRDPAAFVVDVISDCKLLELSPPVLLAMYTKIIILPLLIQQPFVFSAETGFVYCLSSYQEPGRSRRKQDLPFAWIYILLVIRSIDTFVQHDSSFTKRWIFSFILHESDSSKSSGVQKTRAGSIPFV